MQPRSLECAVLPPARKDAGKQVCRMSVRALEQFKLHPGQFIRVRSGWKITVCQVRHGQFDKNHASQPYLQYDPDFVSFGETLMDSSDGLPLSPQHGLVLEPVSCVDSHQVNVKLVVGDSVNPFKPTLPSAQLRGGQCEHETVESSVNRTLVAELQKKCLRCIRHLCVTPGSTVDLTGSRLAKLYGICFCVVTSCVQEGEVLSNNCARAVRITDSTAVHITDVQSVEFFRATQQSKSRQQHTLGGVQEEECLLTDLLMMPRHHEQAYTSFGLPRSSGVLLRGPPGCGKTSLVQEVAGKCGAVVVAINGSELVSSDPGESEANLKAVIDKAVRLSLEGPCVLFIDEIDAICQRRKESESKHNARFTSAVLAGLDNIPKHCGLVVVGATNRPSVLDPALRQAGRLDQEVLMSVPSYSQRREILAAHLSKVPLAPCVDLDWLSGATGGHVGADLAKLCAEATRRAVTSAHSPEQWQVTMEDFKASLHLVHPSLRQGADCVVTVQPVKWEDIGGLDDMKKKIKQAVEWPLLYPEAFQRMGLPLAKGVLLYGPPGCGKTKLVRAAASACQVTFLSLSCAQVYSPFVGDSEHKIVEAFQKARALAPSILFMDEIDAVVGKRSYTSTGHSVQERVLSTLLNEMDGVGVRLDEKTSSKQYKEKELEGVPHPITNKQQQMTSRTMEVRDRSHVLVVAATNRLDMVDSALLRPGRMDRLIYVPPPDSAAREKILEVHSGNMPTVGVNMAQLAADTDGYSGADIENICREAALCALTESLEAVSVGPGHFQLALQSNHR